MPIDAIGLADAMRNVAAAATTAKPFLISTPNLNFFGDQPK